MQADLTCTWAGEALETEEAPRLRITVPHALAIPALLRDTRMLAIVPESLAVALAKGGELVCRQPPYEAGRSTLGAVWHARDEHDVGHAWLSELVATTARTVEATLAWSGRRCESVPRGRGGGRLVGRSARSTLAGQATDSTAPRSITSATDTSRRADRSHSTCFSDAGISNSPTRRTLANKAACSLWQAASR